MEDNINIRGVYVEENERGNLIVLEGYFLYFINLLVCNLFVVVKWLSINCIFNIWFLVGWVVLLGNLIFFDDVCGLLFVFYDKWEC